MQCQKGIFLMEFTSNIVALWNCQLHYLEWIFKYYKRFKQLTLTVCKLCLLIVNILCEVKSMAWIVFKDFSKKSISICHPYQALDLWVVSLQMSKMHQETLTNRDILFLSSVHQVNKNYSGSLRETFAYSINSLNIDCKFCSLFWWSFILLLKGLQDFNLHKERFVWSI